MNAWCSGRTRLWALYAVDYLHPFLINGVRPHSLHQKLLRSHIMQAEWKRWACFGSFVSLVAPVCLHFNPNFSLLQNETLLTTVDLLASEEWLYSFCVQSVHGKGYRKWTEFPLLSILPAGVRSLSALPDISMFFTLDKTKVFCVGQIFGLLTKPIQTTNNKIDEGTLDDILVSSDSFIGNPGIIFSNNNRRRKVCMVTGEEGPLVGSQSGLLFPFFFLGWTCPVLVSSRPTACSRT